MLTPPSDAHFTEASIDKYMVLASAANLNIIETIFLASPAWGMREQRKAIENRSQWFSTEQEWLDYYQLTENEDNNRSRFIFSELRKINTSYPETTELSIEIAHKTLLSALFSRLKLNNLPESWFSSAIEGQFETYARPLILKDFNSQGQRSTYADQLEEECGDLKSALIGLTLEAEFTACKNVAARIATLSNTLAGFGIDSSIIEATPGNLLTRQQINFYRKMPRDGGIFASQDDQRITQVENLFPEFFLDAELSSHTFSPEHSVEQLAEHPPEVVEVSSLEPKTINKLESEHIQPREAADSLGISYQRMLDFLKAEKPSFAFRVGRTWKINRKSFMEWLEGGRPEISRFIETIPVIHVEPASTSGRVRRF